MNVFKMEPNLSLANGMGEVKVTNPEVTFDTSSDFNLAFFEASTPPPPPTSSNNNNILIKKEPDFDERMFEAAVAPDSIFSSRSPYNNNIKEEMKYSSNFSDSNNYHDSSNSSNLSPVSTPRVSSPQSSPGVNGLSTSPNTNNVQTKVIKQEQSYQIADSTPVPSPASPMKSFVPCKVCGDKASGYHYGVTSCEGCKGFFRRSIQKQIEYRCLRDSKCLVIRLNRNRCQFCRFKKCIDVGMSRDCKKSPVRPPLPYSVRYGRVPKRSRESSSDSRVATPESTSTQVAPPSDIKNMEVCNIIYIVSGAYVNNCLYTEEKTTNLARKPIILNHNEVISDPETASSTVDALEQQKIDWWQAFAENVTPSIQRTVEFAKRVPGFVELSQDDQLMLIKGGFFELWLTQISRLISTLDNTITMSDGFYFTRHQFELIFDADFVSSIFNFAITFNNLNLNDVEVGLFVGVVLLTSERPGITDQKLIEQHQDKIVEALRIQLSRNHPSETFTSLAMKLPELRQIGIRHSEYVNWFRSHWSRFKLPPLFAETMDIPKAEDEIV